MLAHKLSRAIYFLRAGIFQNEFLRVILSSPFRSLFISPRRRRTTKPREKNDEPKKKKKSNRPKNKEEQRR